MSITNKWIVALAATAGFAAAPSSALAMLNLENGSPPRTPVISATTLSAGAPPRVKPEAAVTSSSSGFRWDDAGIGAAGMLAILGATSVATRRRRFHRAIAG
jgi:hypothetical protein